MCLLTRSDDSPSKTAMTTTPLVTTRSLLLVGRESVGKTQLAAALTGSISSSVNYRGSTVGIDHYAGRNWALRDTPGILRQSDTETTRTALAQLAEHDDVLLVVQATCLDDDLREMLPLVVGKRGFVVVTFWDKVQPGEAAQEALERLEREAGIPFVAVDALRLGPTQIARIEAAHDRAATFTRETLVGRAGWRIEPKPGWFEHPVVGPCLSLMLLLAPALATIFGANRLAELAHPLVAGVVDPLITRIDQTWPRWLSLWLTGRSGEFGYGLINMGPFLFVWALPTVVLFAAVSALYKTTGLIERINAALHPYVRPIGLGGRDLVRVMMGFGCNVPAVIGTRACSSCSRTTAIAAISFGAACSYQLPATLAVLSATATATQTSPALLIFGFLGYLLITTWIYLWCTAPRVARSRLNHLVHLQRPFFQRPTWRGIGLEVAATLKQFFTQALPVFVVICLIASLLAELGWLDRASHVLAPVMAWFQLPPAAAIPVVMASIRKDGIFLLLADEGLAVPMTPMQVLTAVYLAGVLLPCLVTALQIRREIGTRQTIRIVGRQVLFAATFAAILGWVGVWCSA